MLVDVNARFAKNMHCGHSTPCLPPHKVVPARIAAKANHTSNEDHYSARTRPHMAQHGAEGVQGPVEKRLLDHIAIAVNVSQAKVFKRGQVGAQLWRPKTDLCAAAVEGALLRSFHGGTAA